MANNERPIAELLKELSEQTSTLVHQEVELAKLELAQKGSAPASARACSVAPSVVRSVCDGSADGRHRPHLGDGDERLAGRGDCGRLLYGSDRRRDWLWPARAQVKKATPPVPEQATESVKEDVQWAKAKAQQARRSGPGRHHARAGAYARAGPPRDPADPVPSSVTPVSRARRQNRRQGPRPPGGRQRQGPDSPGGERRKGDRPRPPTELGARGHRGPRGRTAHPSLQAPGNGSRICSLASWPGSRPALSDRRSSSSSGD